MTNFAESIAQFTSGADLLAGAAEAVRAGRTHALVVGDGNSTADDINALLDASRNQPAALVLGHRSAAGSRDGLRHMLLRLESGLRLSDIRGPRIYPLTLVPVINPTAARRYCETEILVRAAWAGCPIVHVELPGGPLLARVPMTWSEVFLHARLICRALIFWPHPQYDTGVPKPPREPIRRIIWRWINPFAAWRELRSGTISRNEMAMGLAIGVFIGNLPIFSVQTAFALYIAQRLHLNPVAVFAGSHVSTPPIGPVLIAAAIWTGHLILHGAPPTWATMNPFNGHFFARALPILLDWALGSVLVGVLLATVVYFVAKYLFRFVQKSDTAAVVQ